MSEWSVELDSSLVASLEKDIWKGEIIGFRNGRPVRAEREYVIELVVALEAGMKIEIFSNEHPPPHFRVLYKGKTANFAISDCAPLNGDPVVLRYKRNILLWWSHNKQLLIDTWNERRPSDCPVGPYRE